MHTDTLKYIVCYNNSAHIYIILCANIVATCDASKKSMRHLDTAFLAHLYRFYDNSSTGFLKLFSQKTFQDIFIQLL